jgi:metallophosphoesterase superfamily enzyme
VRRRCFVTDGTRCVMPAFGAFAGGLNWRDEAFGPLFDRRGVTAFVVGRDRVHAVPQHRCRPDHDPYDWAVRSL